MFRATSIGSEDTLNLLATNLNGETSATPSINNGFKDKNGVTRYGLTHFVPPKKYKYPPAVVFILVAKFFEAFAANGIRTILVLYLRDDLVFSENLSTIMLHIFNFFSQFFPIFGAILADSYLGNIQTISYLCNFYALGWFILVITTFPTIGMSLIFLVSIALLLIAVGNGSIRACITSLGALQFKIPEQSRQLGGYFSLYYFIYYFGIFLSKLIPPAVRANTKCFNKNECYLAVFGTLGSSFMLSWLIFTIGKFFYKPERLSDENVLVKFYGCIKYALSVNFRNTEKPVERKTYWLQYAVGRYEESFVKDVSKVLRISQLFIPLIIYFSLLSQQDSSWTFQASQMNTTVFGVKIQPDQAKAIGPTLLFIIIPLWQYLLAPLIKYCFDYELKPFISVIIGGICSVLAFMCAGILQEYISYQPIQSINVAWQIPQFLLLMMGELFLSIPGLQFAFTQAPVSMKSVVTAGWFINNAFGNLLVVLITELDIFQSQTAEYFFYAVLMTISIIIFALIAYSYNLNESRLDHFGKEPDQAAEVLIEPSNRVLPTTLTTNNK